jgi:hypothetical protein
MDFKLNKSADFHNCRKPEKRKKKEEDDEEEEEEERRKDVISVNHYS